jgi:predicted PolB exonuclease-like 3'-5' exonuclease
MAWPVLVFDIESIPDVAGLRQLRVGEPGFEAVATMSDAEVYAAELARRADAKQSDFMPHYLQRVLVISCVFRNADGLKVHSFVDRSEDGSGEKAVIQQFFQRIEKHVPQLVSWNGGGFDLPVLHYRGLKHGVVANQYWEMGESGYAESRDFKWNNYISRYHLRHLDLMDLLALYQPRANAPLDAMAKLCGFPGKLGMDGSQVYPAFLRGELDGIRRYCETDVMNTYLVYCRFQLMRGGFTEAEYASEIEMVKHTVGQWAQSPGEPHWGEYLAAWA